MSGINDFDRAHIGQILAGAGDERWSYFTAHLLRVIAKADNHNLWKLHAQYPDEVNALIEWRERNGVVIVDEPSPVDRLVAAARDVAATAAVDPDVLRELSAALEPFS